MKNVYPYITNDGSVGLFSPEFDDIYHSTYGAYSEAWEKFIFPAELDYYFKNFEKINVLDICYGIGYNTKSLLQNYYNETIYSDNILPKISIKAVDTDKELIFLSPFFTCFRKRKPKNEVLPTDKIKHLAERKVKKCYEYNDLINFILIKKISENFTDFFGSDFLLKFIGKSENQPFLDLKSCLFYALLSNIRVLETLLWNLFAFVHNIYYLNISRRYKKTLKRFSFNDFCIRFENDDARKVVLADNTRYHLIFLDAFTPTKCPCLWSVDFFKLLYERLDDNGRILTYSNSTQIRNAFINAGFFVGKIYNERTKSFTGTIAVKNKSFIKNELSEYDLSLMKTRAGIFYRDENLNALNEDILLLHQKEVDTSPLTSSSKFIKQYRKEHADV